MLENIRLALRGIKTHKMRSFLTMLGVIIGIASIIGIVSIVEGTNARLEKSLIGSGNNVTNITLSQDGMEYEASSLPSGVPVVSESTMESIRSLDGVVNAADYRERQLWNVQVFRGNTTLQNGKLIGVSDAYFDTMQYRIRRGRPFNEKEYERGMKVAILDEGAIETLFGSDDPLGEAIELNGEPFVIVGIAEDLNKNETEYESIEEYYEAAYSGSAANIYIPESTWPILFQFDEPQNVTIHVQETSQMASLGRSAADILNMNVMNDSIRYAALSSVENENEMKTLTGSIQLMLIAVASLSLLVGGIGVMNIMLVSVTERTAEIGLKKALGAKRRVILLQFLTESAVLTSLGGILGVILGMILARVIAYAANLEFGVSVPWIIIAVLFSVFIGILFGGWPAFRAAKLNPIEALRRE